MALSFSGSATFSIDATYKDTGTLTTPTEAISISRPVTWTGSNGNRWYRERISLVASTPVNRDLYNSLVDELGNTLSLATVRLLAFQNRGTTGQNVTLTGNFMTGSIIGASGSLTLPPSDIAMVLPSPLDGWAVTDTTKERITLTPGAYAVDVDLFIIGVSA